jgi:flavorubredoxin
MKKSANSELLNDNRINDNEKLKLSLYIKKKSILAADALKLITGSPSRNDVIEKAIDFYFGYITSQLSQDYLCGVFGSKMEGLVNNLATRISKGNFRTAVESDILTRMLATVVQMSKSEYDRLRVKAIQNVKKTNGSINILEAVEESEND